MDEGLRNRIWNQYKNYYIDKLTIQVNGDIQFQKDYDFYLRMYDEYFKSSVKPRTNLYHIQDIVHSNFFNFEWYEIYDFIEYASEIYHNNQVNEEFKNKVNNVLKAEMSAYRFVDGYIAPIIDDIEIKEIEEALNIEYNGAKRHLSNALEFLSDRENPDYPNSIKESISAVEAVAKNITGKETDLSKCLKVMDLDLNKQFKTAMDNMYGWTCKEDGIRHGHTGEELKTSFDEAKYMLVTCSAFVNYMIAKKG